MNLSMARLLFWSKLVVGAAILVAFIYVSWIGIDPDLWWHLKVGEWILAHGEVPHADIYSHTMPGYDWVDHEWLIDAWFAWMDGRGAWPLVALFFGLITFLPVLSWLRRAESFESLWIVLLGATFLLPFIGVRAQVISFALFFFVYEVLRKRYGIGQAVTPEGTRLFFSLPAVFFVWANLHAGFFGGLVLFGMVIGVEYAGHWWKKKELRIREALADLAIWLASAAVTFINPYGWKLYHLIFSALFSYETQKYIIEWQPGLNAMYPGFLISVAVFVFFAFRFFRRYAFSLFTIAAAFFVFFLKSVRHGPLFMVTALPFIREGLRFAREEILSAYMRKPYQTITLRLLAVLAASLFLLLFSFFVYYAFWGSSVLAYPTAATEFLKEESRKTNIVLLNDYGWGGYLIYHAPEIKVFIDGRMPQWADENGKSAMKDYVRVFYSDEREAVQEVITKYGVNTVLTKPPPQEEPRWGGLLKRYFSSLSSEELRRRPVIRWLANYLFPKANDVREILLDAGWETAYQDEAAIVLRDKKSQ